MRFYLDEDISPKIAEIARGMGIDVVAASECGRLGEDDSSQLDFAAAEGRCLVTRNRDHFKALTLRFINQERPHAGILVVPYSMPSDRFSLIAWALAEYDARHPDGISPYTFDFLPRPAG